MSQHKLDQAPVSATQPDYAGGQAAGRCWELYVCGTPLAEMARIVGDDEQHVAQTIDCELQHRQQAPQHAPRAYLEKLIDELNLVRQAAWSGWQRSTRNKEKTVDKTTTGGPGGGREEATHSSEAQAGDTAFLRIIVECNKRESALRGIDRAARVTTHLTQTNVDIDTLIMQVERANARDQAAQESDAQRPRTMGEGEVQE